MKRRAIISLSALVLLGYVLVRVAHLYPKWEKPGTEAVLSWDVYGYYLYLPATFIYHDLDGLGFKDSLFVQYRPAGDFHHATPQPDGGFVMKYPIGMAVAYLPWFGVGHLAATLSDTYAADGFSQPYQQAVAWGMILYALLGLLILRRVLLRFFQDREVAIVLGILVLATNYLNYTAFDGAMPHNMLFTLYAALLWLTAAWHERPRAHLALLIGLCVGWATIIRPTELMSLLIPLLWGIRDGKSLKAKLKLLWTHWQQVLLLGFGLILMGSLQMIYWKWSSGSFLYYSYGEFGFDWLRPHLINGLFSYRKGWLVYTPVMILALIGFWPLFRQERGQFWPVAIFTALNLYVVFAWEVWWYGGSFGARPLVQSYAFLALPLGAAVAAMLSRRWLTVLGVAFMLLCADLNLMMTWQAHGTDTGWHSEAMTRAYFWKIFGKSQVKRSDRKFLDVKHELGSTEGMRIRTLYVLDFEGDTSAAITRRTAASGTQAWKLDGSSQFTPAYEISLAELGASPEAWIRVSARTYYEQMEWNEWKMAQLSTVFLREGKAWRQTTARIQRATEPWRWETFTYEMRIPRNTRPTDVLKVYVWNAGSDREVLIDDLKVELIEP
ncbi:MAG: hypothetical protein D6722_22485 [Bacteroidetes bacterium]|nr:MAG: hypothetical protein D6722_22485 [Bacteroidota bacterium]